MVREAFRRDLLTEERAREIAVEMLGLLAADPEKLSGFLALAGIGPENLREAASGPGFLQAVLDYVCSEEMLLRELADAAGRTPELVDLARQKLAGPQPDWGA